MNIKYLQWALVIVGALFLLVYPMMHIWPSGWRWDPPQYEYEQMIMGIYATLGVFLIRAAKKPLANLSLIQFTIWSSIVHATMMLFQVFADPSEMPHLFADIPALYIVAFALLYLTPKGSEAQ